MQRTKFIDGYKDVAYVCPKYGPGQQKTGKAQKESQQKKRSGLKIKKDKKQKSDQPKQRLPKVTNETLESCQPIMNPSRIVIVEEPD